MFTNCITYDDLPSILPIFPLSNALLLPNGILPLQIFEPRYIKMIDDAMKSHRCIGIIQPDIAARNNGNKDAVLQTGCMGRITQFSETEDDRYIILVKGLIRFEINEELSTVLPYRQVSPQWDNYIDDIVEDCDTIQINREKFLPVLKKYLDFHDIDSDWHVIEETPCETLLTTLPMICPFEAQEKQMILELKTLDKRYQILYSLLEMGLQSGLETDAIKH